MDGEEEVVESKWESGEVISEEGFRDVQEIVDEGELSGGSFNSNF